MHDKTQELMNHMATVQIEETIRSHVRYNHLDEIAQRRNAAGVGPIKQHMRNLRNDGGAVVIVQRFGDVKLYSVLH